jgi:hypothetical protein
MKYSGVIMKKLFLYCAAICFGMVILNSCSTVIEHRGACDVNKDLFFNELATVLDENGFNIQNKDSNKQNYFNDSGYLKSIKKHIEGGITTWIISLKDNKITALCYSGVDELPKYFGNDTDKSNHAYWEIINFLEKNCGSKFEIIRR